MQIQKRRLQQKMDKKLLKPLKELILEAEEIERILKFSPLKKGHIFRLEIDLFLLREKINKLA